MTLVISFTKMLNNKGWINSFFKQLIEYPIIIDYQKHKGNEIPNDILQNLRKKNITIYDFQEFHYITYKLRILDVRKEITSKQFICLIDETYKFNHFIVLRGKKITKCNELHVRLVLFLNLLLKCYNQQSKNIYDTLVEKVITDEDLINDHPLFTFDELIEFYNSNLKIDIENFLSQANSYEALMTKYCKKDFFEVIVNNPVYNDYKQDRFNLLFTSAFIQYFSMVYSNDQNLPIAKTPKTKNDGNTWEQAKKEPTYMKKEYVRKLLIYRDEHPNLLMSTIINRFPKKMGEGSRTTIFRWLGNHDVGNIIENYYRKVKLKPVQRFKILKLDDLDKIFDLLPTYTKYTRNKSVQ